MKINKIINICFLSIFLVILFGGFMKPYVRPIAVNRVENRRAYQIPRPSFLTLFNKTFQDQYEIAFADQIPLARSLKLTEKSIEILVISISFQTVQKNCLKEYIMITDI